MQYILTEEELNKLKGTTTHKQALNDILDILNQEFGAVLSGARVVRSEFAPYEPMYHPKTMLEVFQVANAVERIKKRVSELE